MVVEWMQHLFSSDTARYPFDARAAYAPDPAHQHDDPLAGYLARMKACGIDRAVLVQPEPYGDDHSLLLDALRREPVRMRGCAHVPPAGPGAARRLADLVRREPRIVAMRLHRHRGKERYFDAFSHEGVRAIWRTAADLGLVVELHIGPDVAAQARGLIEAHPSVPVVIDHFGEPQFGRIPEYADMLGLADCANVSMKLSGIAYLSDDAPLFMRVRNFTRQVAGRFGAQRLLWGGDGAAWVHAHLDDWSETDRTMVLGGNALRLLNWL